MSRENSEYRSELMRARAVYVDLPNYDSAENEL